MTDKTGLGDRMKAYEGISRTFLTRRMPMIIRVDGKAFHTFTRSCVKPWDANITEAMTKAAEYLVQNIQGARLAYVQSDEISVLCTDYETHRTDPWFGKNVQKVASVAASMATAAFNGAYARRDRTALFDARCFVLPKEEVCNYFIWRQQDAVRNSISGLAQVHFSHKRLHGKNTDQQQEMLFSETGINWNDLDVYKKRGWCVVRHKDLIDKITEGIVSGVKAGVQRDWDIPTFTQEREYVEQHVIGIEDQQG